MSSFHHGLKTANMPTLSLHKMLSDAAPHPTPPARRTSLWPGSLGGVCWGARSSSLLREFRLKLSPQLLAFGPPPPSPFTCVLQGSHGQFGRCGTVTQSCWHRDGHTCTGRSCHNPLHVFSGPTRCHTNCCTYYIYASFQHAFS